MCALLLVLQGFCNLGINSDSINIKGSGFSEELNQTCHLLQKKKWQCYVLGNHRETLDKDGNHKLWKNMKWKINSKLCAFVFCGTSWESMSTKQKHLAPGGLAFTKRTFLSSRYANGSKAFRIVSTVVVGFTFFIIMAVWWREKRCLSDLFMNHNIT